MVPESSIIAEQPMISDDDCLAWCEKHQNCQAVVTSPADTPTRKCYMVNTVSVTQHGGWFTAFRSCFFISEYDFYIKCLSNLDDSISFILLTVVVVKKLSTIINIYLDWKNVQRHQVIDFDLENTPLEIKTDSSTGSDDQMRVRFLNGDDVWTGGVLIHFTDPMTYELTKCTEARQPLSNVPSETEKVWTIYKESDGFKIKCNTVMVADIKIASCTDAEAGLYDEDMVKVRFRNTDDAADFYRNRGFLLIV